MSSPSSIHSRTPSPALFRPQPPRRARTLPTPGQVPRRFASLRDELSHMCHLFGPEDSVVLSGSAILDYAGRILDRASGARSDSTQRVHYEIQAQEAMDPLTDALTERALSLTFLNSLKDDIDDLSENTLTADRPGPGPGPSHESHQLLKRSSDRIGYLINLIERDALSREFALSRANRAAAIEARDLARELTEADSLNMSPTDVQRHKINLNSETEMLFDGLTRTERRAFESFVRETERRNRDSTAEPY